MAFIDELKEYNYYVEKVDDIQIEIDQIDHIMQNIKSINFDNIYLPRGDSKTPKKVGKPINHMAELITLKDKIVARQITWLIKIDKINHILDRMTSKERELIERVYIGEEDIVKVVKDIGGENQENDHPRHIRKMLHDIIRKVL